MRKNMLLRLTALVLGVGLSVGVVSSALLVEAEDTISGSYYNFEDGDTSVYTAYGTTTAVELATFEDTKAVVTKGTEDAKRCVVINPSTTTVRPSHVSFRAMFDGIGDGDSTLGLLDFLPLKSSACDLSSITRYTRECLISFSGRNNSSTAGGVDRDYMLLKTVGQDNGTYNGGNTLTDASGIDGQWLEFNCSYNWDNYTAEAGWKITLNLTITYAEKEEEPLATVENITFAPSGSHASYIQNQTYFGVGFGWGSSTLADTLTVAVDNIGITWTDGTNTYAPTYIPEPKALGATLATTEGTDGTIKTQMGFKFTDARTALEKNGETVSEYGAVFVAGTKDYETMKTNAASVIDGTAVEGYVRTVKAEAELPDEYRVTITNSDGDNIGKRVTAIGYVKTDEAIYYTGENTSDDIVQANLNNYSVMSTLKKIFTQTYLVDTDNGTDSDADGIIDSITEESRLANALANYNSGKTVTATLTDIKEAIADGVSTGNTTNGVPKRELLKSIHFALYNSYQ